MRENPHALARHSCLYVREIYRHKNELFLLSQNENRKMSGAWAEHPISKTVWKEKKQHTVLCLGFMPDPSKTSSRSDRRLVSSFRLLHLWAWHWDFCGENQVAKTSFLCLEFSVICSPIRGIIQAFILKRRETKKPPLESGECEGAWLHQMGRS